MKVADLQQLRVALDSARKFCAGARCNERRGASRRNPVVAGDRRAERAPTHLGRLHDQADALDRSDGEQAHVKALALLLLASCGPAPAEPLPPNTEQVCTRAVECGAVADANWPQCLACIETVADQWNERAAELFPASRSTI